MSFSRFDGTHINKHLSPTVHFLLHLPSRHLLQRLKLIRQRKKEESKSREIATPQKLFEQSNV